MKRPRHLQDILQGDRLQLRLHPDLPNQHRRHRGPGPKPPIPAHQRLARGMEAATPEVEGRCLAGERADASHLVFPPPALSPDQRHCKPSRHHRLLAGEPPVQQPHRSPPSPHDRRPRTRSAKPNPVSGDYPRGPRARPDKPTHGVHPTGKHSNQSPRVEIE